MKASIAMNQRITEMLCPKRWRKEGSANLRSGSQHREGGWPVPFFTVFYSPRNGDILVCLINEAIDVPLISKAKMFNSCYIHKVKFFPFFYVAINHNHIEGVMLNVSLIFR